MRLEEGKERLVCEFCQTMHFPDPNADGVRALGIEAPERCPACAVPLVHAAIAAERILYCEKCRGMLIPMDSFLEIIQDLRSRREAPAYTARQPDWTDLDRRRNCPHCGAGMDTHPYCGPGNVIIDDCERCHVNWLDYGELDRIVRAPDRQAFAL